MTTKRIVFRARLVPALLLAVICLIANAADKIEQASKTDVPVYQGKTLSKWIELLTVSDNRGWTFREVQSAGPAAKPLVPALIGILEGNDGMIWSDAAKALGSIGPEARAAVPALTGKLAHGDRWLRCYTAQALWRITKHRDAIPVVIKELENSDGNVRWFAVHILGEMRADAREALPRLLEILQDKSEAYSRARAEAIVVVGKIGAEAKTVVPLLIGLFREKPQSLHWGATRTLQQIGVSAVPALVETLKDQDSEVRIQALVTLAGMEPEPSEATPSLKAALKDKEGKVRLTAVHILWEKSKDPIAFDTLIELLRDRDSAARDSAALFLAEVQPKHKATVPALLKALTNPELSNRIRAAIALREVAKHPAAVPVILEGIKSRNESAFWAVDVHLSDKEGISALTKYLKDKNSDMRFAAADALRCVGEKAAPAVPALIVALKDQHEEVRLAAIEALGNIGPSAQPAIPMLAEQLKDTNASYRVAYALGNIGAAALPVLKTVLADKKSPARLDAIHVVDRIGPQAEAVIPTLVEMLGEDKEISQAAAKALGRIGVAALPALKPVLANRTSVAQDGAAAAISRMKPKDMSAVPALMDLLKDGDSSVRSCVIQPLKAIGDSVIPVLIEALKDPDPVMRASSALALGQFEGKATAALPILLSALKDRDFEVRKNALEAVINIGPTVEMAPVLVGLLDDPIRADCAGEALRRIGPESIPALLPILASRQHPWRVKALWLVERYGQAARQAMPALADAIVDPLPEIRLASVSALQKIGAEAVPILERTLKSKDKDTRSLAASALRAIKPEGVRALIKVLEDVDENLRITAIDSLRWDPQKDYVALFGKALSDKNLDVRCIAAEGLRKLKADAKAAVPALAEAIKTPEPKVQRSVVSALQEIGPDAKSAVPALLDLLKQWDGIRLRDDIIAALKQIDSETLTAEKDSINAARLSSLEHALKGGDPRVQYAAAGQLAEIEPAGVTLLMKALKDEDADTRRVALSAVRKMNPERSVPALMEATKDEDLIVRSRAVAWLPQAGAKANEVIAVLTETLKDTDWEVRLSAATSLIQMQPKTKMIMPDVVDVLIKGFKTENPSIRDRAIDLLGAIGPEASPAASLLAQRFKQLDTPLQYAPAALQQNTPLLPTLPGQVVTVTLPQSNDPSVEVIAWALRRIGTEAAMKALYSTNTAAVPALEKAVLESDERVGNKAAFQLARIEPDGADALFRALKKCDMIRRRVVLRNLCWVPPERTREAVSVLTEALKDRIPWIAPEIGLALGRLGPEAKAAVPALIQALDPSNPMRSRAAIYALRNIGPDAKAAFPALVEMLKTANLPNHSLIVEALRHIDPEAAAKVGAK